MASAPVRPFFSWASLRTFTASSVLHSTASFIPSPTAPAIENPEMDAAISSRPVSFNKLVGFKNLFIIFSFSCNCLINTFQGSVAGVENRQNGIEAGHLEHLHYGVVESIGTMTTTPLDINVEN
jgi:hypothetical protein